MRITRYEIEKPDAVRTSVTELPGLGRDEVLVRVLFISICGSDVQLFKGSYKGPFSYPILFGHEWSGTVEMVGSGVKEFSKGDFVTGDCSRFCGKCEACEIDKNVCEEIEKFGITVDGASADYIIRKSKYLYKAPRDIDSMLLSLTEPISVAAHLIEKMLKTTGNPEDKSILILGGGGIGIAALLLLRFHYSCRKVALYDISEKRMRTALDLGAENPGNPFHEAEGKGDSSYKSLYSGARYDMVIETTGNEKVFEKTFSILKPLGVLGCLGMIPQAVINEKMIVMKALTVVGSIGGTGEFPAVMGFIRDNPQAVRKIITHVFKKSEIVEAFEMSRNSSKALKVCIDFRG
jgi:threonine dehydrogenase-like Zn-dependent dehydrogenase